jgi:hypothetical protein
VGSPCSNLIRGHGTNARAILSSQVCEWLKETPSTQTEGSAGVSAAFQAMPACRDTPEGVKSRPLQSTQTNKRPLRMSAVGVAGFLGSRLDGAAERQVRLAGRCHPHPYGSNGRKNVRVAF